ncbi:hypothetical protein [Flavobacterium sp. AG291]|uniref:hypothetical protein n=1 Tax=Flavobacterium sp. AG291 TaxID=2184000 RepID=UPI000E0AA25F|nr:hypothetical protein [Flavobacterium sp. AG291]RDI13207.1 hypothetical protein DEU42_103117 [Flavobacterium sp. AG291]
MRLAILIIGVQNSGKTSTIKKLINQYGDGVGKIMRSSWRNIYMDLRFKSLRLTAYCIPASPTEKNLDLVDRFIDWDNLPQTIILAEQLNGNKYANTISFLTSNGYHIISYNLSNSIGTGIWDRFDSVSERIKLNGRADEILDDIKKYINSNGVI